MTNYKIIIEKPAAKFIRKQPADQQKRILKAISMLPEKGHRVVKYVTARTTRKITVTEINCATLLLASETVTIINQQLFLQPQELCLPEKA